jgi:purine-binding chemotaxis protein CheW
MRKLATATAARRDVLLRGEHELLSFATGGELYAVRLSDAQEIVVPPPITLVPRAPRAVAGVASVRGNLVTVVDLRLVLGLGPERSGRKGRLLLGRGPGDELMALRIDEIHHVVRLSASQIEFGNVGMGGESSEVVRGIGRPDGGDVLVLLDMYTIFARGVR